MPRCLLIRHASVDGLGERIHGRTPGVCLNRQGKLDACALAERLSDAGILAVYSSPRERAQDTAEALTRRFDVRSYVDDDLDEVDYGDWTGRSFAELEQCREWHQFNSCREKALIPNGEDLGQIAQRTRRLLERVQAEHANGVVALVTHADWIRTAICRGMGIPFTALLKFQIPPASVTVLDVDGEDFRILAWNDSGSAAHFRYH
jgi:broad specificity phosphatase PhoE